MKAKEKAVVTTLRTIHDPEIPLNVYDLKLIYDVAVTKEDTVHILMTLTSPNCPVAESLPQHIKDSVRAISWVQGVELELTFDPPWSPEMLSPEARLAIGIL